MNRISYIVLLLISSWHVKGFKSIVFYNLSVSHGLSYNEANNMCVDRKGNLWVSSGRGLNMFNGQRVTRYFAEQYPQFQNNNVQYVACDSNDFIWLLTEGGHVCLLDQHRKPHRLGLYEGDQFIKTTNIMVTKRAGVVLRTDKGLFRYPYSPEPPRHDSITLGQLVKIQISKLDTRQLNRIRQVQYFEEDRYVFKIEKDLYVVNLLNNTLDYLIPDQDCKVLCKWNPEELLVYDNQEKVLKVIHLKTGTITYPFQTLRDQYGREIRANFSGALALNTSELLLLTINDGIYIFDRLKGQIKQYTNDAANPSSLAKNRQWNAVSGKNGWVFINCRPNGISYFNNQDIIGTQTIFHDKKGNGYHGNITALSTIDNNAFFIGYPEGLIYWKRDINECVFPDYPDGKGGLLLRKQEVRSSAIDRKGRVWLATVNNGLVIIDKNLRFIKHIPADTLKPNCIPIATLTQVLLSPSGDMWVSGTGGICKIDPENFRITNMKGNPILAVSNKYYPMLFRGEHDLYVGIQHRGVYHYNLATGVTDSFTKKNGLQNAICYALNFDQEGTFYVGTAGGVTLFYSNGKHRTYTQKDGLLINGAEGLLYDQSNRMWIGNDVGLACYDVRDSTIKTYDERYGLSIFGFLIGVYHQLSNGEFIFGTPRGLQYFYPDSLVNKKLSLNVSISRIESRDIQTNLNGTETFRLKPSDNHVTFRFSSVEFFPHVRTFYEYKLKGIDKDWVRSNDESSVTYNTLPSGAYEFQVRVSNDGKHWQLSDNKVMLVIETPFYKTWWFILLVLSGVILWLAYVYKQFRKQQLERERKLETELVISYFASQINSHKNEEELLWDIAKNCISKLNFDDCVIYLLDEQKGSLVQKAAYGPKNPVDITIHEPIEIPLSKGICGAVALSGEAEIVNDTSKDPRYIVDDERRFSEISVPIKIDQKVIGVIDSEHTQKHFFSKQHQQILSTIAFLCANQLMKIRAEEEKQRTVMELLENRQKATESRLQSLRLQMNPHFLFNALNSIQQMILAREDLVATSYLSRFSKLLRAILVSSDREMSSLKEEIDILRMYIELESVRFKEAFTYTIQYDEELEIEELKIPTMLIQPFVENAIWHGLMHKDGDRNLELRFLEKDNYLQCVVKDNGVGRAAAGEWKTVTGREKKHVSKGISVAEERLKTWKHASGKQGNVEIIDLYENGLPAGTKVIINFPI